MDIDGQALGERQVTIYDTAAYVVKPATRKRRNSLVEVISKTPQAPKWFASHWWGMPLLELLACLEQHAADRHLDMNHVRRTRPPNQGNQRPCHVPRLLLSGLYAPEVPLTVSGSLDGCAGELLDLVLRLLAMEAQE